MTLFIEWYKNNISFDSQEGKELGAKVISFLETQKQTIKQTTT